MATNRKDTANLQDQAMFEYTLTVPLSAALQDKVAALRKELHEKYKVPLPFLLPPSFTLLTAHAYEGAETRLTERLRQVASALQPFTLLLKNFASVDTSSIRIEVTNKHVFSGLVKGLRPLSSLFKVPDHEPLFYKDPQLFVAQALKPFQFISMWMDCEHKVFTGQSVADAMVLLKKTSDNQYEEVAQLPFMNRKVQVRQGDLFNQF